MKIKPEEVKGWGTFRRVLKKLIHSANRTENISISRNSFTDGVTYSGDSIILNISKSKPSLGGVSSGNLGIHAFQLVEEDITTLCVRQGTVGTIIPTITGGSELEPDYTENVLSLPGTGTREYWLKITIDSSGYITAVTIEDGEPGNVSATQAEILLGSVETDSGDIVVFNSNLSGSQALASCGANHFFGFV
jgi:hypothetical protein